jgi:hypothetical protein
MSIKLDAYHPLSHLGQLLYKDSVAQRDAKIARDTEEAKQRSATDAQARLQLQKALDPALLIGAFGDPPKFAEGTEFEYLFPKDGSQTGASAPTSIGAFLTKSQQGALAGLPGAESRVQLEQKPFEERMNRLSDYQRGAGVLTTAVPQARDLIHQLGQMLGVAGPGVTGPLEMLGRIKGMDTKRLRQMIDSPERVELEMLLEQLGHVSQSIREALPGGIKSFPDLPTSADSPAKIQTAVRQLERLIQVSEKYTAFARYAQQQAQQRNYQMMPEDFESIFEIAVTGG